MRICRSRAHCRHSQEWGSCNRKELITQVPRLGQARPSASVAEREGGHPDRERPETWTGLGRGRSLCASVEGLLSSARGACAGLRERQGTAHPLPGTDPPHHGTHLNSSCMAGSTGTAEKDGKRIKSYHASRDPFHTKFPSGWYQGSGQDGGEQLGCTVTRAAVHVPRTPLDRVRWRFSSVSTSICGQIRGSQCPAPASRAGQLAAG